jgi:hypothetical protein
MGQLTEAPNPDGLHPVSISLAALASAKLPALETVDFWITQDIQQLAAHLTAFFLAWPSTRKLIVRVYGVSASHCLSTCLDILRAHQRHNIQLAVYS